MRCLRVKAVKCVVSVLMCGRAVYSVLRWCSV